MIPEDWEITTLEKASQLLTDGSHFSPKEEHNGKHFIATVKDMEDYVINTRNCKRISEEIFNELTRSNCKPQKGDVLFSKDGTMGLCFVFKQDEPIVILSSIALIRPHNEFDPFFLKYYLSDKKTQDLIIAGFSSGSALPRLTLVNLKQIPVVKPNITEQRTRSSILADLDSKIELNQNMNKTLEEIGQAIFKHWFIDFEFPNEQGKPYKSSGGEMVYNEELEKEMPKDWEIKPLDEIANFLNGLALQKYPPESETEFLPVIKIRELRQGLTESCDKASQKIPNEYVVDDGDVLFSWSGSLEVVIWTSGKGALNQHLFKVTSKDYPKWFYYYWILQYLPQFRHIAEGKATTMGHIQRHHLKDSLVIVPDKPTFQRMDKNLDSILDKLIQVNIESRNLSQIRDSLLPKLISGKIRVPVETS